MNLFDLVRRSPPGPWAEEEKIPWDEPGFSARMLREHLSQLHDGASRRSEIIDRHVDWIHGTVLDECPSAVLDLGCGPGLYSSRLARRGHTCVGVDFSPASIEYARSEALRDRLACTYHQRDLRSGDYGEGFGLALLIFGELNAFRTEDASRILRAAHDALSPGGKLLLEVHTPASLALAAPELSWYTAESGLFGEEPHLVLKEASWHPDMRARVDRYHVVDAASGKVRRYGVSAQAYEPDGYRELLGASGFSGFETHPALDGGSEAGDLFVCLAEPDR